jgi:hypothetical protein
MNWHNLTPYERLISILGHVTLVLLTLAVIIVVVTLVLFLLMELINWIEKKCKEADAKKKRVASVPIDSIPLNYDSKGNRKEVRRELYEDMKGRGKGNV